MSSRRPFVRTSRSPRSRSEGWSASRWKGTKLLLSNIGGEIHAVSGICTHEEFDLAEGFVIENAVSARCTSPSSTCRTGEVYNPPATEPLRVFNVKIDGDRFSWRSSGWVLAFVEVAIARGGARYGRTSPS